MKRFRFGSELARPISDYGSNFRLARLLRSRTAETRIDLAFLSPGDVIARHPAGINQLFCVLTGSGFVSGEDGVEFPIAANEAAYWLAGESHLARSDSGLTALIIQSAELDPETLLTSIA